MLMRVVAAPTAQVNAISLPSDAVNSHQAAKVSFSFFDLFLQADLIVKSVLIVLLVFSLTSWMTIIYKSSILSIVRKSMAKFEEDFWSGKSLEELFKVALKKNAQHPQSQLFIAAMQEIEQSSHATNNLRERLEMTIKAASSRSLYSLENGIDVLATIASSSPFIGLFGTVWGIMNSFQSIALSNNTTLAVVAPGIAEALFATAIGLIVAIPAAIFHNKFNSDINKIATATENFALDFSTLTMREQL